MKYLKKTLTILGLILTFYILYFLQIDFFSWFNIAGVKPNLFIVLVLCLGLFIGKNVSVPYGFVCGLYLDLLANRQIGISCLIYAFIGLLGVYLDKNFSKNSKITILLMVAGSTVVYEVANYIYIMVRNKVPFEFLGFVKILGIEVLFNVLLTIIIYPIIKSVGNYLEELFKAKKILTRYF